MAKILVIDDDPLIVDLLFLKLQEKGHQMESAGDAYSAVTTAASFKPDLITLDFNLPAGDGFEILRRLRGNTLMRRTPIIFLTAMSPYDLQQSMPDDPRIRLLQKPIDMDRLNQLIAELLGQPAPQSEVKPFVPPPSPPPPEAARPKEPPADGGVFGGDILDLDL